MNTIRRTNRKTPFLEKIRVRILRKFLEQRSLLHLQDYPVPMAIMAYDFIGNEIAINGVYELNELQEIFEIMKDFETDFANGTACDIGANIGNHTRYFADKFKKVIAFEPNPLITEILRFNSKHYTNINISQFALGDFEGTATISGDRYNIGGMSISPERIALNLEFSNKEMAGTTIQVRKLDSMLENLENLQFMKIDVEGFEQSVIKGATETIRKFKPVIAFEQWPSDFVNSNSQAITLLREMGYVFYWQIEYTSSNLGFMKITNKFLQSIFGETKIYVQFSTEVPPGHYSMLLAIHETKASKLRL